LFNHEIGFSDHSLGYLASCIAVGLGATIIEKHVTLRKNLVGPDHKISLNIREFSNLVFNIRKVEKMMGKRTKPISKSEKLISKVARKSIVAKKNLCINDVIKLKDICYKRPGTGLSPLLTKYIINKKIKNKIKKNTLILKKDIA
jgi:sialic acid synthase SpsE